SLFESAAPSAVAPGTELTYTLTATNAGPSDADNVSLTDSIPAGTSFVRVAQGSCATSGPITCTVGALANGASATVVLVVRVNASAVPGDTITNTARVFNTPAIDPVPANNNAIATATVGGRVADLGITKTASTATDASGATVDAGGFITYTITATNAGPSNAPLSTVSDTLPSGTTLRSVTAPGGFSCTPAGGDVPCAGSLSAGASAVFTVVASVGLDQPGA